MRQFIVKPREGVGRDEAIDDVIATMRGLRGLRPAATNNFYVLTQDRIFEVYNKFFGVMFLVVLVLASVGLMVGGVGVIAIMMISVTERTREIGVRKALGATKLVILWQFLVESITLTGIGVVIGLATGWGLAAIVRLATPIAASVPPMAVAAGAREQCADRHPVRDLPGLSAPPDSTPWSPFATNDSDRVMTAVAVDVLAIAAHPDDVELTCGGTLLRALEFDRRTAIIDLTAGRPARKGRRPHAPPKPQRLQPYSA